MPVSSRARPYVLEDPMEARRLERQVELDGYRLDEELEGFDLVAGDRVLDAGCGTGVVARRLSELFEGAAVEACDISAMRLKQAENLRGNPVHKRIRFFESSLERIGSADASFDKAISRYVFEHLQSPEKAARELCRVLKPGGGLRIIDFDGILFNLHHGNRKLAGMLDAIAAKIDFDLHVGRKIPLVLKTAGFSEIRWRVQAIAFQGESLRCEEINMRQRLAFALPVLSAILGSKEKALDFTDTYCAEMLLPGNTLFYNKFIVDAER